MLLPCSNDHINEEMGGKVKRLVPGKMVNRMNMDNGLGIKVVVKATT